MNAHEISTQELCKKIPDRFQMILVASIRAREIARGSAPKTSCKTNRPGTLALLEILEGKTGIEALEKIKKER